MLGICVGAAMPEEMLDDPLAAPTSAELLATDGAEFVPLNVVDAAAEVVPVLLGAYTTVSLSTASRICKPTELNPSLPLGVVSALVLTTLPNAPPWPLSLLPGMVVTCELPAESTVVTTCAAPGMLPTLAWLLNSPMADSRASMFLE